MYFVKQASDLTVATGIMDRILKEDPTYWPYGLSLDHFDRGGSLYLIQKSASMEPVGFVGWQSANEGDRKIGYYAIGVLPEYRHQGFAKAAVSAMLQEKSASVDEVRALVCSHNEPSQSLAKSLPGVNLCIHKSAAIDKKQLVATLLGALGTAAVTDQAVDPANRPISSTFQPWKWDKERALMGITNLALGGLGGHNLHGGEYGKGLAAITLAPTKDLALKGIGSLSRLDRLAEAANQKIKEPSAVPADKASILSDIPKPILLGALGLGAGGLGLAAYAAKRKADAADEAAAAARAGRVRVTLPTKQPGDSETTIDLPVENINLSNAQISRLGRDTRRRLMAETNARTRRRKPKDPSNPTEREIEDQQLLQEEAELDKEAAIIGLLGEIRPHWFAKFAAAQPTVPVPPGSPAAKMQQQQAQANSIDTSTAANPQIMKAQQDAQQASMQAQQQVAQAEQAGQQKAMEQAAQHRDQLAQADQAKQQVLQENQILKLQLEKSKAESALASTKFKMKEEISKAKSDAEGSLAGSGDKRIAELIGNRISRLRSKFSKKAGMDPLTGKPDEEGSMPVDPQTGLRKAPPLKPLRYDAAQDINTRGMEYTAEGRMPQVGIYRTSYGPIGDYLYSNIFRGGMLTPTQASRRAGIGDISTLNNPDKLGMIEAVNEQAQQFMNQPQY